MGVWQKITSLFGSPTRTRSHITRASRDSGAHRETVEGWYGPQVGTAGDETRERIQTQRRADDLSVNDWAAHSAISAITQNSIGTGLIPKSTIPADMLGIAPEAAREVGKQMEWAFADWSRQAHLRGILHFEDLQFLGLRSMLRLGEMLHRPTMLSEAECADMGRSWSVVLQEFDPRRLMTPGDLQNIPAIVDGIELSEYGRPLAYYVNTPQELGTLSPVMNTAGGQFLKDFRRIPARVGHHPGMFHLFRYDTDEQVRGVSTLSTGIGLFRNLNNALHWELYAQVMAASAPLFIGLKDGTAQIAPEMAEAYGMGQSQPHSDEDRITSLHHGQILYGRPNEKPQILECKRPSPNFTAFVEIITRAMSASVGIPYESLTKDFSKTNYSSARAALNEAWKLYKFYRQWFARLYCQPVWEMVMEEAFLRGRVTLPKGAPGFFAARALWCNASWVGPARGFVDPVKEITAIILALNNRLMTHGEAWAERGEDFDEGIEILRDELHRMDGLNPTGETRISKAKPDPAKPEPTQPDTAADGKESPSADTEKEEPAP